MFKLMIECSKDIDSINIVFSDGKAVATAIPKATSEHEHRNFVEPLNSFDQNTSNQMSSVNVDLPEVPEVNNRDVKVANNLQNLDI